jgi:hypothetical protein
MARKKKVSWSEMDLSSPQKVDEFMEAICRDMFGCTVEQIKQEMGEELWQQRRQELIDEYVSNSTKD